MLLPGGRIWHLVCFLVVLPCWWFVSCLGLMLPLLPNKPFTVGSQMIIFVHYNVMFFCFAILKVASSALWGVMKFIIAWNTSGPCGEKFLSCSLAWRTVSSFDVVHSVFGILFAIPSLVVFGEILTPCQPLKYFCSFQFMSDFLWCVYMEFCIFGPYINWP